MSSLIFDLQRFAATVADGKVTIPAGDTYTLDGITYTAIEDAQLNLDNNNKVSGIASGKVQATVTGAETSSTLTIDATNGSTDFTLTGNGEVLTLTKVLPFELDNGTFTLAGNVLTVAKGSDLGIGTGRTYADGSIVFGHDYADTDIKYTITDTTLTEETEQERITFTATLGEKSRSITTFVSGKVINGLADGKFTGGLTITKDSSISLALGNDTIKATANSDATSQILVDSEGINITPDSGDGTLSLSFIRNGKEVTLGELKCTSGKITFDYANKVTFAKGTSFDFTVGDYTLTATTTDDAGGAISLGADGITFKPNSGDGGLEISVTRDGQTRTASLDMTGSVTYKLDGSISLAKGTVVRNVFEDGNILTITAKSDASGSMIFTPNNGLDITPSTPNALDILLSRDGKDIIEISGITGSVNYKGGGFTASDGTTIHFVDPAGYYDDNELRTSGGTTTVHFGEHEIDYTPGENATFTMDYLQGTTWVLQNGTLTDYFSGPIQGSIVLSEGSIFDTNDNEFPFALEKAGNYTLNGMKITTNEEYTDALLTGYDTVQFAADSGIKVSTIEGGKLFMPAQDESDGKIQVSTKEYGNFEVTNGSITFDSATRKYSCAAGTTVNFTQGGQSITFTADKDISATYKVEEDIYYFMLDGGATARVSLGGGGQTIAGDLELGGVISYRPSTGTIGLTGGNSSHGDGTNTYANLTLDDGYGLRIATDDTTMVFVPKITGDGKLEFNFPNARKHALKFTLSKDGQTLFDNHVVIDGTLGIDNATQELTVTKGTTTVITSGDSEISATMTADTAVKISDAGNGKILFTPGNSSLDVTIKNGDKTTFNGNVQITDGSIVLDAAAQTIGLTKGTLITLTQGTGNLEIKALDDTSGKLTLADGKIRFAPTAGDGALELNFSDTGRKVALNVTGAVVYGGEGKISLEDGTVIDLTWDDGVNLKMTSHGSTGSIAIDEKRGLKITSDDENLDIALTTPNGVQTNLSGIKGTLWYNSGTVSFEENSTITATTTLGGQPIFTTLETIGGTGHISFNTTNGVIYSADTGAMQITWARDGKESTFTVNSGTIQIGHNLFKIAEGSDLSTDLKDLVPALYFTTSEAGTYTVNGQKVTTSTANIPITATDDMMTFNLRGGEISVDDLKFTGNGNVKITAEAVTVGNGVEVAGLGKGNSFVLTEAGNVTVDNRVFELLEDVPTGITVTGDNYGFEFSRTLTKESEERLGIYNSPDIGKIFTERFSARRDDSYRVQTDLLGLQQIIGISAPVTVTASAALDDEEIYSVFDVVTETDGIFKIADKPYTISGDSSVTITGRFDSGKASVRAFNDLNGTVSGDFTDHALSINGNTSIRILGDRAIDIVTGANGAEIFNLSNKATLESLGGVSKVHTDTAGKFQFGVEDDSLGVTIRSDDNVTFEFDSDQFLKGISGIEGDIILSETAVELTINGITGKSDGEISTIGAYGGLIYLHDVTDGTTITTKTADKYWIEQVGASMAINDNTFTLAEDDDGIWIHNKEIVGLDDGASLTVSEAGSYIVNGEELTVGANDIIVGFGDAGAYIYNPDDTLITRKSSTEEIVNKFKPNNTTVVDEGGVYNISMSGGDLAIIEKTAARVNISAGDDTVVSQGKNVHVSLTGGNAWLFPTDGKMTLEGYDASTGMGFDVNYKDLAAAVQSGAIAFDDGELSIGSATVDLGKRSEIIYFYDRARTRQAIGFASHSAELDGSDWTQDLILVGDTFSTLRGGAGDDTIFASESSYVNGGDGKNLIKLPETRNGYAGATIDIANGRNTIENFSAGFDVTNDLIENSSKYWDNVFDGTNVSIKTDNGTTILKDIGNGEAFVNFKESANGYNYKVAIAQKNSVIAAGDELADIYTGENSGVDFTGFEKPLSADLRNNDGQDIYFYGINSIAAGDGSATIIGSANDETLTAGTAGTSIWGGAGYDLLRGNTSDNKGGSTEFYFLAGDDKDTIRNFEFYDGSNLMTADKINVGTDEVTSVETNSKGNVLLQINNGDDWLTLEDAQGKDFRINNLIAKVDTTALAYDDKANCFVATDSDATLTVDESAEIWLSDGQTGLHGKYYLGEIKTLDASKSLGENILAGNALDNTIIAGDGNTSLWGGEFGDDLLIGGNGTDIFIGGKNQGADVIENAETKDEVHLNDATLSDIVATTEVDGLIAITFNNGNTVAIQSSEVLSAAVILADDSKYRYNHATKSWQGA